MLVAGGGVADSWPLAVGFCVSAGCCASPTADSINAVDKIATIECRRNLIMFSPSSLRLALPLARTPAFANFPFQIGVFREHRSRTALGL